MANTTEEKREGIHFYGRSFVTGGLRNVELYLEGQQEGPVYSVSEGSPTMIIHPFDWLTPDDQLIDKVFQEFVTTGRFESGVRDPQYLEIFRNAQTERLNGEPWYKRTHRFLPAADFERGKENYHFIFTSDKSDLEREYQIAANNPKSYSKILKQRKKEEKRKFARIKMARKEKERVRKELSSEITSGVFSAIDNESFPEGLAKRLSDVGLLEPSTTFRMGCLYPGEEFTFRYDVSREKVRHSGFIGFGKGLELITIDERLPKERRRYKNPKESEFVSVD